MEWGWALSPVQRVGMGRCSGTFPSWRVGQVGFRGVRSLYGGAMLCQQMSRHFRAELGDWLAYGTFRRLNLA